MTVDTLVKELELLPHPEGGYYKETYRSESKITQSCLSPNFKGDRNMATGIYFLIEKGNFSALHKIKSDETWHFYFGDALEVIEINEQGNLTITQIGSNLQNGETFQYTVKANTWFGSRVSSNGHFSLVGCTVYPGFDFQDFELAQQQDLIQLFPQHQAIIKELTRQ
ncbi:MAG: cupin domain-containing protein [Bacteroidetes bacterium]|nr:cupin domain-containing protein [Bacteroidota bacterium]